LPPVRSVAASLPRHPRKSPLSPIRASGKNSRAANKAYNKAVASLETRVLVSARKFKDYGVSDTAGQIEELEPVETIPRLLQAPKLLASREDDEV
jgi:DNA recombination protein RmuC